jgi:hypothetical protein
VDYRHVSSETSWDMHGFVRILDESGALIANHDTLQHNKNFRERGLLAQELADKVSDAIKTREVA